MRLPNKVQILSNGKCKINIDLKDIKKLNKIKERHRLALIDKTKDYIFAGGFEADFTRTGKGSGSLSNIQGYKRVGMEVK